MKDYYSILKLERKASPEEIRKRYRELALEYHPDVSMHENAHAYFVEVNEAFHVLGDPDKKGKYDVLYDRLLVQGQEPRIRAEPRDAEFHPHAEQARQDAQQSAKVRYREFLKHANCFFSNGRKADGSPYYYAMHRTTGIAGGTGPTGSIKARAVLIPIPRSSYAVILHRTGLAIKLVVFSLLLSAFRFGFMPFSGYVLQILFSIACICAGGLVVRWIYGLSGVAAKNQHADRYFLVEKYKKRGYVRGFHPVVSTTPLGIVVYVMRWIL